MQKSDFDYIVATIDDIAKTNDVVSQYDDLLNVCRQLQAAYRNQDEQAIAKAAVNVVYECQLYLCTLQQESVLKILIDSENNKHQNLKSFRQYHFDAFIGDKWSGVLGFKVDKNSNMIYDILHHAWFLGCIYSDKQDKLLIELVKSKQTIDFFE